MPIEIKELHIRVAVNSEERGTSQAANSSAGGRGGPAAGGDMNAVVAECVDQVLQILRNKTER